jgi:uncharacterized protein (DUF1800 family)
METSKTRKKIVQKKPHKFNPRDKNHFDVGYLMRRAGFGATPGEIDAAAQQGLGPLVTNLVNYEQVSDNFVPPPDAILTYRQKLMRGTDLNNLQAWWIDRMINTSRPLQEKMALFWHGHFATGYDKVRSTLLMYRQNELFRQNALGRFDDLLSAVYRDPAMLIYLDGQRNTKQAPNENWGREVMELFVLGRGHYTEADVHASARSFTGWRIDSDGNAVYIPRLHDIGSKTLLGQSGNWDGEDAVRILAAHPATGPWLAHKLWRFFASDQTVPRSAIQKLSKAYYASDHSTRDMVRVLFTMPEFYEAAVRHGHLKSPTEFVVTTIKQLGLTNVPSETLPRVLTFLGQELFWPPNVGGWPGGANWINAATMLGRFNFASSLTGEITRARGSIDPQAILTAGDPSYDPSALPGKHDKTMSDVMGYIGRTLGIGYSTSTARALQSYAGKRPADQALLLNKIRGLVHLALVSPEYQAS